MAPKRYVPLSMGVVALGAAAGMLFGFEGWWRYLLVIPLFAFGWMSVKTAFFASDQDVRELTGDASITKDAEKRFADRL